jgi:hypothetical protein
LVDRLISELWEFVEAIEEGHDVLGEAFELRRKRIGLQIVLQHEFHDGSLLATPRTASLSVHEVWIWKSLTGLPCNFARVQVRGVLSE